MISFVFSLLSPSVFYLIFLKYSFKPTINFNCTSEHSILIFVISLLVLGLIFILNLKKFSSYIFQTGFGFILGSGMYNIWTRIFSGCVADYINFFNISFVNLADILIFIGLTMVIFSIFKYNKDVKTVMIIEDEPDVLAVYAQVLKEAGYSVVEATNGIEGLKVARSVHWDLLLLDIMIPGEDGMHVLKTLKEDKDLHFKPVILLTNLDSESIINESFNLGADGYLIKSEITPDKIVTEVGSILNR